MAFTEPGVYTTALTLTGHTSGGVDFECSTVVSVPVAALTAITLPDSCKLEGERDRGMPRIMGRGDVVQAEFETFATAGVFGPGASALPVAPQTTGRLLMVLRQDQMQEGLMALSNRAGLNLSNVASPTDFAAEAGVSGETLQTASTVVFEQLGIAVICNLSSQGMYTVRVCCPIIVSARHRAFRIDSSTASVTTLKNALKCP
jgi:hypothetical protein